MEINIKYSKNSFLDISESRKLEFLDGVDRIITLKRKYWNNFDLALNTRGNDALETILYIAYELALESCESEEKCFEACVRQAMPLAIRAEVDSYYRFKCDVDQDDRASEKYNL